MCAAPAQQKGRECLMGVKGFLAVSTKGSLEKQANRQKQAGALASYLQGTASKRLLFAAAATAVALVSLWLYPPEEQVQKAQWAFGGGQAYSTKQPSPAPEGVKRNKASSQPTGSRKCTTGHSKSPGKEPDAVPDVQSGTDKPGDMGAAAGATLVLMAQALYLLIRKYMPRSNGSTNTSASEQQKTLAADLGALLRSGHSSDITFIVGENQLRAHRAILVARSPVFAAMMAHDCLEATSGRIAVADIEADVMNQLLVFLYTDEVQLVDPLMAQKLLTAADKYQLPTLKEQCELVISSNLCVENAAACAVLAIRHSCSCLRKSAADFIATHFREVMATRGWAEAVREHPDHVVEVSRLVAAASTESR